MTDRGPHRFTKCTCGTWFRETGLPLCVNCRDNPERVPPNTMRQLIRNNAEFWKRHEAKVKEAYERRRAYLAEERKRKAKEKYEATKKEREAARLREQNRTAIQPHRCGVELEDDSIVTGFDFWGNPLLDWSRFE